MHTHANTRAHAHTHIHKHNHSRTCLHTLTSTRRTHTHTHTHTHSHTCVHTLTATKDCVDCPVSFAKKCCQYSLSLLQERGTLLWPVNVGCLSLTHTQCTRDRQPPTATSIPHGIYIARDLLRAHKCTHTNTHTHIHQHNKKICIAHTLPAPIMCGVLSTSYTHTTTTMSVSHTIYTAHSYVRCTIYLTHTHTNNNVCIARDFHRIRNHAERWGAGVEYHFQ